MINFRLPALMLLSLAAFLPAPFAFAQSLNFVDVPPGYRPGSIVLPRTFAGALGADPDNDEILYASLGSFGDQELVRIDLNDGTATTLAAGPFGSIGGLAAISSTELVLVENDGVAGSGLSSDTLLLARDLDLDGDFNDAGEIEELIEPILVDPSIQSLGFTGAQARLVPPGNPSGIPSGSIMFQTADGSDVAELMVVVDPLDAPAFRPNGGAYFGGFDFNGGFDFDSQGRIFMGALDGSSFTGDVYSLVNLNGDEDIDVGEPTRIVTGETSLADLVVDAEDDVLIAGADPGFVAAIRTFRAPDDPVTDSIAPTNFATTDAGFLSAIMINSKTRNFEPNGGPGGAVLVVGGFDAVFSPTTNLLTLTPAEITAARDWERYE